MKTYWVIINLICALNSFSLDTLFSYYEHAKPKEIYTVDSMGVQQGEYKFFYPSGNINLKEIYFNGLQEGLSYTYYESGKIKSIEVYNCPFYYLKCDISTF